MTTDQRRNNAELMCQSKATAGTYYELSKGDERTSKAHAVQQSLLQKAAETAIRRKDALEAGLPVPEARVKIQFADGLAPVEADVEEIVPHTSPRAPYCGDE